MPFFRYTPRMGLHERIAHAQRGEMHGIQEGRDAERAVFGVPTVPGGVESVKKVPFEKAVAFVKEHQPNQLKRSSVVSKLRALIAESCGDTTTPVKFYTAVGTALDFQYGADAFFEQGDAVVTVDISLREKDAHKADVFMKADMDKEGRVRVDGAEIERVARNVAEILDGRRHRRAA